MSAKELVLRKKAQSKKDLPVRVAVAALHEGANIVQLMYNQFAKLTKIAKRIDDDVLANEMLEALDPLYETSDRMVSLLKDTGKSLRMNRSPERYCCMAEVIETSLLRFYELALERDIAITVEKPEFPVILRCNEADFDMCVGNLVTNAIKAIGRDGRIHISITDPDDLVVIKVRDTAGGIGAYSTFDQLLQTSWAFRNNSHSLGLKLVKSVVEGRGGRVMVNLEGGESVFTILIPRVMR